MLQSLYNETIGEIRKAFAGIYPEPNKAAFAVAEEFKDIVIRSNELEGRSRENQWRRFYRSIRGRVWPEEYGASQRRNEVCSVLRAPLNEFVLGAVGGVVLIVLSPIIWLFGGFDQVKPIDINLNVTMLGASKSGKTTLLGCM